MRIATFNILSGRSPADDQVDTGRFADAVARLDADILGLQEVDRNQPRSQHSDLTTIAAEAMGAPEHRFVAALRGTPGAIWSAATGDEQPDDAAYGIALLSRYPVAGWRVVRLPAMRTPTPFRFHGQVLPEWVRDEPRVAVVAEVETPRGRIHVANTHLSYLPWWNGVQLRLLLRGLGEPAEPVVLLGDLNMGRRRAERITSLRPLATGLTFPTHHPVEQIDHILASDGLVAADGGSVELSMSDHRALVAEVH
jgi:endonuclease/exonuclease/phosphatase family metal-dependent hydrolase